MKIAIGADHRGFNHKQYIKEQLSFIDPSIEWVDVGAFNEQRSDYPVFARLVAQRVQNNEEANYGILICGSGVGMAVTANRYHGIYAGLAWNEDIASVGREHDNINVLVLPSDFISQEDAVKIVTAWFNADFFGGRYQKRIDMIDAIK